MLSLPLPLRPDHRLSQLLQQLQQLPLARPHALVHSLQECVHESQPWLLEQWHSSVCSFGGLPAPVRKQLTLLDEESQRLHWLYEFFSNPALTAYCTTRGAQIPQRPMSMANTPSSSPGGSPYTSPRGSPSNAPLSPPHTILSMLQKTNCQLEAADPNHSTCGLLMARMQLLSRMPDHLLRLLKWLVTSQAELCEQRQRREQGGSSSKDVILAQIDRVIAQYAFMEEVTWKLLWRVEQLIKSGILSTCACTLPASLDNLFSPWWNHDCLIKAVRVITNGEQLSETAIYSFTDLMLSQANIFNIQVLSVGVTRRKYRSMTMGVIREADMIPSFLLALSSTSLELANQGLEFLSMLLIRVPENGQVIVRQGGWKEGLVPLLLAGGAQDANDPNTKAQVSRTLHEIANREQPQAAERRGSIVASPTRKEAMSAETLLSNNVKLAIHAWVLLIWSIFVGGDNEERFSVAMWTSLDAIEDRAGWLPHTILLVRVLLVSFVTKIATSTSHRRTFRNDVNHPSWPCLFDLLTVCENFLFYSPLLPNPNAAPSAEGLFRKLKSQPNSRRTASANVANTAAPESIYLARSRMNRRFKSVGVHQSVVGVSEDEALVDRIRELLESLKFHELDSAIGENAELVDKERMRKLKKRGLAELEFFNATSAYLKSCSKKQLEPDAAVHVKAVPELLERRRHQRELSGSRLSSVFDGFTRNRRVKSIEEKLNNNIAKSDGESASPPPPQPPRFRPEFSKDLADRLSTGRNFNLATRMKHARPAFNDAVHAKINLELVKMKIESFYLPHKRVVSYSASASASPVLVAAGSAPGPGLCSSPDSGYMHSRSHSPPTARSDVIMSPMALPFSPMPDWMVSMLRPINERARVDDDVPWTALPHLANRPLPPIPTLALDKQVASPIVLSPHNNTNSTGFEPKEEGGRDEDKATAKKLELRCCHCNIPVASPDLRWHFHQPYCRLCIRFTVASCSKCGDPIGESDEFAKLTGVETSAAIKIEPSASSTHSRNLSIMVADLDDTSEETVFYHAACLSCTCCDAEGPARADSVDSLPSAVDKRWFQHQGLIYCKQHYAEKFCATCAQCHQIITEHPVHALDKTWHAGCFTCAGDCGRALSAGKFLVAPAELVSPPLSPASAARPAAALSPRNTNIVRANKSAFCESCFHTWFEVCHFCGETLEANEKGVRVKHARGKKPYHRRCYQCVVCLQPNDIDTKLYAGEDDECLYCYRHFAWKFFAKCGSCNQPVAEDDSADSGNCVCVNDVDYHRSCVRCVACMQLLPEHELYTKAVSETVARCGQVLLCAEHQDYDPTMDEAKCASCRQGLTTGSQVAIGESVFHHACVACSVCRSAITPEQARMCLARSTPLFCSVHHPARSDCAQCTRPLSRGNCVRLGNGLQYHVHCLYCAMCRVPLGKAGQMLDVSQIPIAAPSNKIYCAKHLPR